MSAIINLPPGFKRLCSLSFIIIFFSVRGTAGHLEGGEISYTCTAPGTYLVTLKLYRACSGIELCPNCPSALSPSCGVTLLVIGNSGACAGVSYGNIAMLVVTATPVMDAIQLCSLSKTVCNNCGLRTPGSFNPGVEIYTFQGTLNTASIPSSCCEVVLAYSSCCKSPTITTLSNPGSLALYLEIVLNRCIASASPVFSSPPAIAVCAGQNFSYNMGATDPDGDSLSYGLAPSLDGHNVSSPYISGYSPSNPFPYLGAPNQGTENSSFFGMYLNPVTGDLRFRPLGTFSAPFILETKQYRTINNVVTYLGNTRRDIIFYSQSCPANSPPEFRTYKDSLAPPEAVYNFSFCAGTPTCVRIAGYDFDQDSTYVSWNLSASLVQKGATLTKAYSGSKPKQDSTVFCWTPAVADINNNKPYYFLMAANDNRCAIPGRAQRTFSVTVKTAVSAQITKLNTSCKNYSFGYNRTGPKNGTKTWRIQTIPGSGNYTTYTGDSVLAHSFTQHGVHNVFLMLDATATNCETVISDTVIVPDLGTGVSSVFPNAITGESLVCKGKMYTYHSDTINSLYTYQWQVPTGWSIVHGQGTNEVDVVAGLNNGMVSTSILDNCAVSLPRTLSVSLYPAPVAPTYINGDETPCKGSEQVYSGNLLITQNYYWQVPPGYTIISGQGTDLIKVITGNAPGTISLRSIMGCDTSTAAILYIRPFSATPPAMLSGDSSYCPGSTKTFSISGTSSGHYFQWFVPAGWSIVSGQGYSSIIANTAGAGGLVKVRAIYGCDTTAMLQKLVMPVPVPQVTQSIQGNDSIIGTALPHNYSIMPHPKALGYTWKVPAGWSIISGQGTTAISVMNNNTSGTIWVKMNFDCNDKDSISKAVAFHPISTSNGELLSESEFICYPNPSNGIVTISYLGKNRGSYQVTILTLEGKEVLSKTLYFENSSNQQLNLETLSSGTYMIKAEYGNMRWHKLLLLTR